MRILVVHHRLGENGDEDQTVDQEVALLKGAGVEVEVWNQEDVIGPGIKNRFKALKEQPYNEKSRDELAKRLARFKPRLVHFHNLFPSFTPSLLDACIAAKTPNVQTLHDFRILCATGTFFRNGKVCELCINGTIWPALRHACEAQSRIATLARVRMIRRHRTEQTWNRKVNAFIAFSHFSAGKMAEGGISKDKIFVKPNFAFAPTSETLRASDLYALYVGPLTEEKGIRTLLKAWEGLTTPLWIIGDGPLRAEVEARKSQIIKVLGEMPRESVLRIMSKAEFLVIPSESYEHFPLALAKGFSLGLPVIAARIAGLAEAVRHEKNGLLFEPGNAQNLHSVAKKLAEDVKLHDRLSEGARADYVEKYNPKVNLKKLLEIYQMAMRSMAKSSA